MNHLDDTINHYHLFYLLMNKMLVDTRVALAQKNADYDELTLRYQQLEKLLCDTKLQLAKLKEASSTDFSLIT